MATNIFTILGSDIGSATTFVQNIGAKIAADEKWLLNEASVVEKAVATGAQKLATGVDAILSTAITVTEPDEELSATIAGFKGLFDALMGLVETTASQGPGGTTAP